MKKSSLIKAGLDSVIPMPPSRTKKEHHAGSAELSEELQELIAQAQTLLRPGRPAKHRKDRSKAEVGCKEGETRYSVVMKKEHIELLKDAAYWQRDTVKNVLAQAIDAFLKNYEKKNGPLKARKA